MANKLETNKKQGQKVDCSCKECHRVTKHEIVTEATVTGSQSATWDHEVHWAIEYQVVQCLG